MSAYGTVAAPSNGKTLAPRLFPLPERVRRDENDGRAAVLCVPFGGGDGGKVSLPIEAKQLMADVFNEELKRGLTYPQMGPMSLEEFSTYFCSYELIVGIFLSAASLPSDLSVEQLPSTGQTLSDPSILQALLPSPSQWKESLALFYYIKPNYPGRSSHLCNAGFVVPPTNRGLGLGGLAGRSFLHFAPELGYQGSVFNLVYENNVASLSIWQRLGFTQVGKIPGAGLLRTANGQGEEYVDAWVIHCNFEERRKREEAVEASREVS